LEKCHFSEIANIKIRLFYWISLLLSFHLVSIWSYSLLMYFKNKDQIPPILNLKALFCKSFTNLAMIINFSVQNFASIKDKQILSFEADKSTHLEDTYVQKTKTGHRLLKLGLIYGANASGKTNIINSLYFLRSIVMNPINNKTDKLIFNPFLLDDITPNENTFLSIEFIQNETKYFYEVELNRAAIVKEALFQYKQKKSNIFRRTTDLKNQFTEIEFGSKIKIDKTYKKTLGSNTLWNNTVLAGFLKTNIELKELKEVVEWFAGIGSMPSNLTTLPKDIFQEILGHINNDKDFFVNFLRMADFNISNLLVNVDADDDDKLNSIINELNLSDQQINKVKEKLQKSIEFEHLIDGRKYALPYEAQSDGTKKFLILSYYLFALLKSPYCAVLLIDELEASLHPELYTHFLMTFLMNSKNSQILATTHNREILNNKDVFRDDAIWITNKNNQSCSTELYSLADFDTSVIRDTTNRLNAYKSGKLGGVPNLGDYFIDLAK